jgi:hypothetical protein
MHRYSKYIDSKQKQNMLTIWPTVGLLGILVVFSEVAEDDFRVRCVRTRMGENVHQHLQVRIASRNHRRKFAVYLAPAASGSSGI